MRRTYCLTVTGIHLFNEEVWVVTFPKNEPRDKDFYAINTLCSQKDSTRFVNPICMFTKAEAKKFISEQQPDYRQLVFTMVTKKDLSVLAAEMKLKEV